MKKIWIILLGLVLVSCSQKTTQPTQDFVPGDKSLVMTVGKLENTGSITDFSIGLRGFSSISKEDDRIDTVTQFSVKTDVPQNFFLTQNSYSSTGQLNYITPHTDIFEGTIPVDPKTKLATFSFKQIFWDEKFDEYYVRIWDTSWGDNGPDEIIMDVSNVTPLLADNADFEQFFIHGHYNYNSKISYILSDGTLHDFPLNNIITDMEVKDPDTNTLWARCHDFFCWAHVPTETAKKIQKIKLSLEKLPE